MPRTKIDEKLLEKVGTMIDEKLAVVRPTEVPTDVPDIQPPTPIATPEEEVKLVSPPPQPEEERKIVLSPYLDNGLYREQLLLILTKISSSLEKIENNSLKQ